MDGTAPAKDVWIGRAMPRREDARLLAGRGRFADDLAPEGALWLEVVRSPYPAGRIVALDVTEAAAMPGVALVLTAGDLALCGAASVNTLMPGARLHPMEVLAQDRVRAAGQAVAAVLATSAEAARDAAEAVVLEVAEGADDRDPGVVAWSVGGPVAAQGVRVAVAVDHALVAPLPLEPRAALAVPGDVLTVWLATQTPQRCRDDLCALLGLPRDALRVVAPDVGGAFGGKASLMPEDVLVALAALRLGRAVRWRATRSDDFLSATQGRGAATRAEGWVDGDGRLTGLRARMDFPLGHWMPHSALAPVRNGGRILPGPYAVPQVDVAVTARLTEGPGVNIYRGAGRPEAAILMERLIDRAAQAAGIDPLEARRRNLAVTPRALPSGDRICSGDFAGLLGRLEAEADYAALRREQAARRAAGAVCGIGLALYVEPCGQGWESASVTLLPDGRIRAGTGSSAQGQGRETAVAQIAAQALGVAPDQIEVAHGDTDAMPDGIGALASRSTPVGGAAMWQACAAFLTLATDAAARHLNRAADGLHAGAAGLTAPDGAAITWAALAESLPEPLTVSLRHEARAEAWASGAVLAQVTIDRDTGAVTVDRITWVDDAGTVINPTLLHGQLIGGLAQGLGAALMERIVQRDGQLLTGSLMDYALPRATDMPPVRIVSQPTASPANDLGAKGAGEAGCIGVPAAILNAVQDALIPFDAPDLNLPVTAETVWRAIHRLPPRTA